MRPPRFSVSRLRRSAAENFGAVFRVARNPRAAVTAFEHAWHLMFLGALVIGTPEGEHVLIATSLQLHGDMVTAIHSDLLQPDREAERDRRTEEHLRKVHTALAPLQEIIRAHRGLQTVLFGTFGALQGAYWLNAVLRSYRDWTSDLAWLAVGQLGCWFPMLLRWLLPRLLRWSFRTRLARLLADFRETTHQEHQNLARKMAARGRKA